MQRQYPWSDLFQYAGAISLIVPVSIRRQNIPDLTCFNTQTQYPWSYLFQYADTISLIVPVSIRRHNIPDLTCFNMQGQNPWSYLFQYADTISLIWPVSIRRHNIPDLTCFNMQGQYPWSVFSVTVTLKAYHAMPLYSVLLCKILIIMWSCMTLIQLQELFPRNDFYQLCVFANWIKVRGCRSRAHRQHYIPAQLSS
jgi:hypothetical protein